MAKDEVYFKAALEALLKQAQAEGVSLFINTYPCCCEEEQPTLSFFGSYGLDIDEELYG